MKFGILRDSDGLVVELQIPELEVLSSIPGVQYIFRVVSLSSNNIGCILRNGWF